MKRKHNIVGAVLAACLLPLAPMAHSADLVGIDFGPSGSKPTNWTLVSGAGTFTQLKDETGAATALSLTVSGSPSPTAYAVTPYASTLPIHTPSLSGLDGNIYGFSGTFNAVFSGLIPNGQYYLWIFGLRGDVRLTQSVTVTGTSLQLSYTQSQAYQVLAVNDEAGSSTRTLESYADTVQASNTGTLSIRIVGGGDSNTYAVAGLAIQSTVPEPSTWALLGCGAVAVLVACRRQTRWRKG